VLSARRATALLIAVLAFPSGCSSSNSSDEPRAATNTNPSVAPSRASSSVAAPPGYTRPLMYEEFGGATLDRASWSTCYWWSTTTCTNAGNNELQLYTAANVDVRDGTLRLIARRENGELDGDRFAYSSGMISGARNADVMVRFRYGYIEARARVPRGRGLWSAFWLLPTGQISRPEVDIFEIVGEKPNLVEQSTHAEDRDLPRKYAEVETDDITAGWHTFGLRWEPHGLRWYVDGEETFRVDDAEYIPQRDMYLIANLAVGGDFTETPDATTPFPSALELDYVRVWQRG
jgi:beta-glucanase (GH16 family)